jgi:hypothetical protein
VPYTTFNAPIEWVAQAIGVLTNVARTHHLTLECCAEGVYGQAIPPHMHIGCVSPKDTSVLKLNPDVVFGGANNQRNKCLCCSAKKELIPVRHPCPNDCVYCYWKNQSEK